MATLDDTVGYQLLSGPCAQYAVHEKTVPSFSRTEIQEAMDTDTCVSSDELYHSKFLGNVSITDHRGAFVGHVLASTNTSLQVRQLESHRIRIKGFVNAITSGISNGLSSPERTSHMASPSEFSGRAITSLHLVESDKSTNCRSSGEKCSWEPSEITNGTPAESSYDSLNRNRSEEIERHQSCHSPRSHVQLKRCSTARVDHIFGLSPFDTNGKPPLAPSRNHKARLNGSKSSDCLQDRARGEPAPRSSRFTKGVESSSRKVRTQDLHEKCRNTIPLSPSRSPEDFTPDFTPEHHPLTLPLRVRSHKTPDPTDKGWRLPMKRSASLSDLPSFSVEDEDEPLEKKIKLASTAHPAEVAQPDASISPAFQLLFRFNSLKCSWATSCRKLASAEAVDWAKVGNAVFVARPVSSPTSIASGPFSSAPSSSFEKCDNVSTPVPPVTFSLKATALQQLCAICSEQDRLRAQFISEVSKSLGVTVRKAASRLNNPYGANNIENSPVKSVEQIILNFQKLSMQQLERQEHELRWAIAVDGVSDPSSISSMRPKLSFRHMGIFSSALLFDRRARQMISDVEAAVRDGMSIR